MSRPAAIEEATTNAQRSEVQALFERSFNGIDPTAVPRIEYDTLYAPLIVRCHDSETGRLIGAALTCRAQVAVDAKLIGRGEYNTVLDKHSQLDLMCVVPEHQGRGIGSGLVCAIEDRLRQRGVRVWFGNATKDLDTERLQKFYSRHGFKILPEGQPLPDLLGKRWIQPLTEDPAFWFYKRIR
jgi:GNAT superfamily N-acetyltransferase